MGPRNPEKNLGDPGSAWKGSISLSRSRWRRRRKQTNSNKSPTTRAAPPTLATEIPITLLRAEVDTAAAEVSAVDLAGVGELEFVVAFDVAVDVGGLDVTTGVVGCVVLVDVLELIELLEVLKLLNVDTINVVEAGAMKTILEVWTTIEAVIVL